MQFLPFRQHVDDARQLQHEERDNVEGIIVARVKHIDWPHVDVMNVVAAGHRILIEPMEMTAQADIFLHAQNIADDRHVFLWAQMLSLASRTDWEDFSVVCIEYVRLIRRCVPV